MRHFFRRDLLIIFQEGFLIIANRSAELAVLSLRDVCEFVNQLKKDLKKPTYKIKLCENCFFCQDKFIFQAKEVAISPTDVFNFITAIAANLNFALMSDLDSAFKLFLLKQFSHLLLTPKVATKAESCLLRLRSGLIHPLLSDFVATKLKEHTVTNITTEEVLKFVLFHHEVLTCLYDVNLVLKD